MSWLRYITQILNSSDRSPRRLQEHRQEFGDLLVQLRRQIHCGHYTEATQTLITLKENVEGMPEIDFRVIAELYEMRLLCLQEEVTAISDKVAEVKNLIADQMRPDLESLLALEQGIVTQPYNLDQAEAYYNQALKIARENHLTQLEGQIQGHIGDVALQQGNASYAVHMLRDALSKINMIEKTEFSAYFIGRLGQAMIALGEVREGEQYLSKALRISDGLGYIGHECLWRKSLAERAIARGKYGEARNHIVVLLIHTPKDKLDYVRYLCWLHFVCQRMGEYKAALDYADQAMELVSSEPHHDLLALAQAAKGISLRFLLDYSESWRLLQSAIQGYMNVEAQYQQYSFSELVRHLAAVQVESGAFEDALASYDLALRRPQANEEQLEVGGIYHDRGALYLKQGRFDETVADWMAALAIYQQEAQHVLLARLHCEIANLLQQQSQISRAVDHYGEALLLLGTIDDETRGLVLAGAAPVYMERGDIDTAKSFFLESIKLAQKTGDAAAEATRRGNYGWFLLSTGQPDRAMASLSYALRQSKALDLSLQVAVQTHNIGCTHFEMTNLDSAIRYHRQALELISQLDQPYWQGIIQTNLAIALIEEGSVYEAHELLESSLDLARAENKSDLLASVYTALSRFPSLPTDEEMVTSWVHDAVSWAEKSHSRRLMAEALISRSDYYMHRGQQEAAEMDWQKAKRLLEVLQLSTQRHAPQWIKSIENLIDE